MLRWLMFTALWSSISTAGTLYAQKIPAVGKSGAQRYISVDKDELDSFFESNGQFLTLRDFRDMVGGRDSVSFVFGSSKKLDAAAEARISDWITQRWTKSHFKADEEFAVKDSPVVIVYGPVTSNLVRQIVDTQNRVGGFEVVYLVSERDVPELLKWRDFAHEERVAIVVPDLKLDQVEDQSFEAILVELMAEAHVNSNYGLQVFMMGGEEEDAAIAASLLTGLNEFIYHAASKSLRFNLLLGATTEAETGRWNVDAATILRRYLKRISSKDPVASLVYSDFHSMKTLDEYEMNVWLYDHREAYWSLDVGQHQNLDRFGIVGIRKQGTGFRMSFYIQTSTDEIDNDKGIVQYILVNGVPVTLRMERTVRYGLSNFRQQYRSWVGEFDFENYNLNEPVNLQWHVKTAESETIELKSMNIVPPLFNFNEIQITEARKKYTNLAIYRAIAQWQRFQMSTAKALFPYDYEVYLSYDDFTTEFYRTFVDNHPEIEVVKKKKSVLKNILGSLSAIQNKLASIAAKDPTVGEFKQLNPICEDIFRNIQ